MEELDLNNYLFKQDLYELFKFQLTKDFESAGLDITFTKNLPKELKALRDSIQEEITQSSKQKAQLLPILLYRIDISELQIKNYSKNNADLTYEAILAELIIKRILQKVILKKTFSNK
jgi:hypothetical protein